MKLETSHHTPKKSIGLVYVLCIMALISASELGALGKDEFVAKLGGLYENSPWVRHITWGWTPAIQLKTNPPEAHASTSVCGFRTITNLNYGYCLVPLPGGRSCACKRAVHKPQCHPQSDGSCGRSSNRGGVRLKRVDNTHTHTHKQNVNAVDSD